MTAEEAKRAEAEAEEARKAKEEANEEAKEEAKAEFDAEKVPTLRGAAHALQTVRENMGGERVQEAEEKPAEEVTKEPAEQTVAGAEVKKTAEEAVEQTVAGAEVKEAAAAEVAAEATAAATVTAGETGVTQNLAADEANTGKGTAEAIIGNEVCDAIDLKKKKNEPQYTRMQQAIANICGTSPNSNILKSILWCGAKFTVASVVFGPVVAGWLVAHANNHEYFSKKEEKLFGFINTFSWSDNKFVKGPEFDKGKVGPAK